MMQYKTIDDVAQINPDSIRKSYPHKDIEYIDIASVGTGNLIQTTSMPLSEASSRAKRLVSHGDTILSTVRPNRRSFLYVKKPKENVVVSTGFAVLRAKNGTDPRYLYYAVTDQKFTDYLTISAKGAAYPAVDTEIVQRGKIPYWSTEIQKKISAILASYDDLIENNARRIELLEEFVQRIYREWFVDYRFPGHEKARFVKSELGKIPEGWQVLCFTDCVDVLSGGTPKTTVVDYWNGSIPFFTPKDSGIHSYVTDTEKHITEVGLKKCNSKLYAKNTVFITARGTVGKVVLAGADMAMNQSCYALLGKDGLSQSFVFSTTKNQVDYLKTNTGGATFDTIIVDTFKRMKIVYPNRTLIKLFDEVAEPLFKEILALINTNENLKKTRDLLLPKLVYGDVDTSKMDIVIREQANVA